MGKYVVKRIVLALITAFIILSVTFMLMRLLPFQQPVGFPVDIWRYYEDQVEQGFVVSFNTQVEGYGSLLWSTEGKELIQDGGLQYYYYQRPILEQYGNWIWNIVTEWNWGTS